MNSKLLTVVEQKDAKTYIDVVKTQQVGCPRQHWLHTSNEPRSKRVICLKERALSVLIWTLSFFSVVSSPHTDGIQCWGLSVLEWIQSMMAYQNHKEQNRLG